jgi:hypothetical protein
MATNILAIIATFFCHEIDHSLGALLPTLRGQFCSCQREIFSKIMRIEDMSLPAATLPVQNHSALQAFVWGGLLCGVLDITAALVVYGYLGAKPLRLLQGIAGGLLGPRTYGGGVGAAFLRLFCHFLIAFSAAAVYVAASQFLPFLVQQAAVCGALYGVAVYFFMNRVVVPLSAAIKLPFSLKMMLIGVVIHIFCVGLPIALVARRFSRFTM